MSYCSLAIKIFSMCSLLACCMLPASVLAQDKLLLTILPVLAGSDSAHHGSNSSHVPESGFVEISESHTVSWKGREWQQSDDGRKYTWEEAGSYCEGLTLDGNDDWTLPTWDELKSLVVCSNGVHTPLEDYPGHPYYCGDGTEESYNIPTNDDAFESHPWYYWSRSEVNTDRAWALHFGVGGANQGVVRTAALYVRCVRKKGR